MSTHDHALVRTEEAMGLLRAIDDPITNALVNNAMFHLLRRYHERKQSPEADFDLRYFVELMCEMMAEHDVLRRILAGERVGAFFDEET